MLAEIRSDLSYAIRYPRKVVMIGHLDANEQAVLTYVAGEEWREFLRNSCVQTSDRIKEITDDIDSQKRNALHACMDALKEQYKTRKAEIVAEAVPVAKE